MQMKGNVLKSPGNVVILDYGTKDREIKDGYRFIIPAHEFGSYALYVEK